MPMFSAVEPYRTSNCGSKQWKPWKSLSHVVLTTARSRPMRRPGRLKCESQKPSRFSASDGLQDYGVPTPAVAKQLGLNEFYLQQLMELPGTETMYDLKERLAALAQWNTSLQKGILPRAADLAWPAEPFRSKFLAVMKRLEMARFTRRYPQLLGPLLKEFLTLVQEFEAELKEEEGKRQQQQQQKQQPMKGQQGQQNQQQQQEGDGGGDGNGEAGDEDMESQEGSESADGSGERGEGKEVELSVEDMEGGEAGNDGRQDQEEAGAEALEEAAARFEERVDELLKRFEDQWTPAVDNLDIAGQAFQDIDQLLEGPEGFDSSRSVWRSSGWREIDSLRRKLERLRELRDLVRSLGRGGGKGPLKKAPEEVLASRHPPGVIRSEESPEETRGLTRSGDLSRMLPLEAHLLAAGWPRRTAPLSEGQQDGGAAAAESSSDQGSSSSRGSGGSSKEEGVGGSRACRMLFMARRAERQLMSYERTGWVEEQPSRLTGRREVRPAAELGPIILCLDTSGSMYGAREVVAKALALECMRGAHRQQRKCYLYAFSGPGEVMQLELGTDGPSLQRLLSFLTMSFNGGTDVDAPLALSLDKVGQEEWALADILMVTDGEIPPPSDDVMQKLAQAREELGLEVHGLLVGRQVTDPMRDLCDKLHVFKSWSAVGGEGGAY